MKLKTFYSEEKQGDCFVLSGQEMIHSFKVYRLNVGDEINIICGDDNIYRCKITEINTVVKAQIIDFKNNASNPKVNLTVFQCNLKSDKMEYLVQKLTEIGVSKFVPVISENIVKKEIREDRLEKISKESSKQCGRSRGIEIEKIISFNEMLKQFKKFNKVFVAHEKENNVSIQTIMSDITGQNCAILIGPEGGLSENEILKCKENGAIIFGLGERVLRAETACVSISTLVLFALGEFGL